MLIDFLIGLGAMNALPHYLFGRMDSGVLSLFGFSAKGNLCYSAFCLTVSVGLFAYKYGVTAIGEQMIYAGAMFVVVSYLVSWSFVDRYLRKRVE